MKRITKGYLFKKNKIEGEFFKENKSNLKKTWEGIRGLINVNKKLITALTS